MEVGGSVTQGAVQSFSSSQKSFNERKTLVLLNKGAKSRHPPQSRKKATVLKVGFVLLLREEGTCPSEPSPVHLAIIRAILGEDQRVPKDPVFGFSSVVSSCQE